MKCKAGHEMGIDSCRFPEDCFNCSNKEWVTCKEAQLKLRKELNEVSDGWEF